MNNNSNTGNEERDPKEVLANRVTYVILALLLVAVLTVTVVAIVATVSKRNDAPPDDGPDLSEGNGDNSEPNGGDLPSSGDDGNKGGDENNNGGTPGEADGNKDGDKDAPTVRPQVFVRPCNGYISKAYSSTVLSASTTMSDYRTHEGVDIVAEVGAPVYALSDGTVTDVSYLPMMGQSIEITHSNGIVSKYMNLSTEIPDGIKIGAEVAAGDLIGAIGETSLIECAEQPHLHLEVLVNGKSADPTDYVTFSDDVSVSTDE